MLAVSLLGMCKTSASKTEGLLWKISGNGLENPSYLFGTYHTMLPFFLEDVKGFDKAFNTVKQLVVEIDFMEAQQSEYTEKMFLPKGITYSDLLSENDYGTLDSVLQRYMNVSADKMNMSPGYVNYFIQLMYFQTEAEKWKNDKNILSNPLQEGTFDEIIYKMAVEKAYPVVGLETNKDRRDLGLLKAIGLESDDELSVQVEKLIKGIRLFNTPRMHELITLRVEFDLAYSEQQITLLESTNNRIIEFMKEHALELGMDSADSIDEQNEVTLKKRNLLWIEKIPALIQDQPSLIAVGAVHLVGEYGLITLLRKEGFVVEPIN